MKKLLTDATAKEENPGLVYPDAGQNVFGSKDLEEFDRVSIMASQESYSKLEEVAEVNEIEKGLVLTDPFEFPIENIGEGFGYVELPFLVSKEAHEMLDYGSPEKTAEVVKKLKEKEKEVTLHIPLLKPNYRELEDSVRFAVTFSVDKLVFSFPAPELTEEFGGLTPSLTRMMDRLEDAVDKAILQDKEVEIRNVPFCQMVGYKRYLSRFNNEEEYAFKDGKLENYSELRQEEKFKPGQCNICKYEEGCEGIWRDYFEKEEDKEIMPVTGKVVLTDNERCMVSILMEEEKASTKKILELKSSERFKDICANCVGSDDVMVTGNNLKEKGVVEKKLEAEGYQWCLNRGSELVENLEASLEA